MSHYAVYILEMVPLEGVCFLSLRIFNKRTTQSRTLLDMCQVTVTTYSCGCTANGGLQECASQCCRLLRTMPKLQQLLSNVPCPTHSTGSLKPVSAAKSALGSGSSQPLLPSGAGTRIPRTNSTGINSTGLSGTFGNLEDTGRSQSRRASSKPETLRVEFGGKWWEISQEQSRQLGSYGGIGTGQAKHVFRIWIDSGKVKLVNSESLLPQGPSTSQSSSSTKQSSPIAEAKKAREDRHREKFNTAELIEGLRQVELTRMPMQWQPTNQLSNPVVPPPRLVREDLPLTRTFARTYLARLPRDNNSASQDDDDDSDSDDAANGRILPSGLDESADESSSSDGSDKLMRDVNPRPNFKKRSLNVPFGNPNQGTKTEDTASGVVIDATGAADPGESASRKRRKTWMAPLTLMRRTPPGESSARAARRRRRRRSSPAKGSRFFSFGSFEK